MVLKTFDVHMDKVMSAGQVRIARCTLMGARQVCVLVGGSTVKQVREYMHNASLFPWSETSVHGN